MFNGNVVKTKLSSNMCKLNFRFNRLNSFSPYCYFKYCCCTLLKIKIIYWVKWFHGSIQFHEIFFKFFYIIFSRFYYYGIIVKNSSWNNNFLECTYELYWKKKKYKNLTYLKISHFHKCGIHQNISWKNKWVLGILVQNVSLVFCLWSPTSCILHLVTEVLQ